MTFRITLIWVAGLMTIVPYSLYQLLFHAQRDEYALLITIILFWIFGFWAIVAPLLSAYKIRQLIKQLESPQIRQQMISLINSQSSQNLAIDLIARENRIPRYVARKLYHYVKNKYSQHNVE